MLLLSLLASIAFSLPSPVHAAAPLRVIVDPGHGGEDMGANRGKYREKDISLSVATELARLLNDDKRFSAFMTRRRDEAVALAERSQLAVDHKGDIFVSIHCNSSPASLTVRGAEFYFENQNPTDEESLFLASRENEALEKHSENDVGKAEKAGPGEKEDLGNILKDLAHNNHIQMSSELAKEMLQAFNREHKLKTRTIRQAPFHVLSAVDMPSTLVELGFISTPEEAEWLARPETQKRMARALYEGLVKFKEKLDKKRAPALK